MENQLGSEYADVDDFRYPPNPLEIETLDTRAVSHVEQLTAENHRPGCCLARMTMIAVYPQHDREIQIVKPYAELAFTGYFELVKALNDQAAPTEIHTLRLDCIAALKEYFVANSVAAGST